MPDDPLVGDLHLYPSKYEVIAVLEVMYIKLGTAPNSVPMIVLTTTNVLPMIQKGLHRPRLVRHFFAGLLVAVAEVTLPRAQRECRVETSA